MEERATYDFFILHDESNDNDYARKILDFLETNRQLTGFMEARDGHPGQSHFQCLEHAVTNSRFVLVLISEESIKDGWWGRQMETSLMHGIESRNYDMLVPIYLPNLDLKHLPMSLSVFNGAHFSEDINNIFWTQLGRVFAQST